MWFSELCSLANTHRHRYTHSFRSSFELLISFLSTSVSRNFFLSWTWLRPIWKQGDILCTMRHMEGGDSSECTRCHLCNGNCLWQSSGHIKWKVDQHKTKCDITSCLINPIITSNCIYFKVEVSAHRSSAFLLCCLYDKWYSVTYLFICSFKDYWECFNTKKREWPLESGSPGLESWLPLPYWDLTWNCSASLILRSFIHKWEFNKIPAS